MSILDFSIAQTDTIATSSSTYMAHVHKSVYHYAITPSANLIRSHKYSSGDPEFEYLLRVFEFLP